ncbi:MAG: metallophosphoesterase [Myxococcota bacterium]
MAEFESLSLALPLIALLAAILIPAYAGIMRGRTFAIFSGVILLFSVSGIVISHARLGDWLATAAPALRPALDFTFAYLMLAAAFQLSSLVKARLHGIPFRLLVTWPGQAFLAAGLLAAAWLLLLLPVRGILWALGMERALDVLRPLDLVPYILMVASLITTLKNRTEFVRFRLGRDGPEKRARVAVKRYRRAAPPSAERALRIVQISDPHLGPWQSVERLQKRIETLLGGDPDLVLLTGDYLTMEGQGSPGALAQAFAPLRGAEGRCFAIFGNHDHEAADEVRAALSENKVPLLVDEEAVTQTALGPVQILGADYARQDRAEKLEQLMSRHPRREDHLRLLLLHDPQCFAYVPPGDADLTLSGHTHGGQLGLVSLGLDWTVLSGTRWPDHGLFARGPNRLYVHRGTGFYGFPLRIGVPGEASLLEVLPSS